MCDLSHTHTHGHGRTEFSTLFLFMGFKGLSRDEFLFLFCFPRRSGAKAGNLYNNTHTHAASPSLPPFFFYFFISYFVCVNMSPLCFGTSKGGHGGDEGGLEGMRNLLALKFLRDSQRCAASFTLCIKE